MQSLLFAAKHLLEWVLKRKRDKELGKGECSMRGVFEPFSWFKIFEGEVLEVGKHGSSIREIRGRFLVLCCCCHREERERKRPREGFDLWFTDSTTSPISIYLIPFLYP
jgi:hypothetical protein